MAERALGERIRSALQWFLRIWREGIAPEMIDQLWLAQMYNMDVRDLLPKVSVPTLVVHYRNDRPIPVRSGARTGGGDSLRSVGPAGG
jgi:pimeloyl-ACP methyl ester carboxylesterase